VSNSKSYARYDAHYCSRCGSTLPKGSTDPADCRNRACKEQADQIRRKAVR
jgi:hypothetical protein